MYNKIAKTEAFIELSEGSHYFKLLFTPLISLNPYVNPVNFRELNALLGTTKQARKIWTEIEERA